MKKALRQEFYEQMHTILPDLYQKAYALKGNKIEAEMLTENILLRGAKQFSALANKARFRDILLQKIETGTHMDLEATDLDALAARVMEKIEKKDNIKKMVWGVCAGVLSVGIFVTVIIPNFPSNIPDEQTTPEATTATDVNGEIINPTLPVIGEVTMKDTKTIKGDNKAIFFENYHNLSKALNKNTHFSATETDVYSQIERYCSATIAPNGTAYLAFNNISNTNGNNMFTLYHMTSNGWESVAEGESQADYSEGAYGASYYASRIYLVSDKDSKVYVFTLLNDEVTVYKYDPLKGELKKSLAVLPCKSPTYTLTYSVYYDAEFGEKGGIYVGYSRNNKYHFACYDIANDVYISIAENIGTMAENRMMFCVENSIIHMVTQSNGSLYYYHIDQGGYAEKQTLFNRNANKSEYIVNRNSGAGGVAVDENGDIHIIATCEDYGNSTYSVVHYKVSFDGIVEKETLPKLYYVDTDGYKPMCVGVFAANEKIYYIEKYKAMNTATNIFSIGLISETIGEDVVCLDVIETPNGIGRAGARVMNDIVIFYSNDDIYYYSIALK